MAIPNTLTPLPPLLKGQYRPSFSCSFFSSKMLLSFCLFWQKETSLNRIAQGRKGANIKSAPFLSSGLYRRFRNRTGSAATQVADSWLSPITAGGESHPALKQTFLLSLLIIHTKTVSVNPLGKKSGIGTAGFTGGKKPLDWQRILLKIPQLIQFFSHLPGNGGKIGCFCLR